MYLINENELSDYLFKKLFDYLSTSNDVGHLIINRGLICERWADEFLKDKKPVTEIANLTLTPLELLSDDFTRRFEKYLSKDITIYIQVKE